MISSRNLEDLHPKIREKAEAHISACKAEGIDILVTCTYRDLEAQDALYAQGRTKPGTKVTNAKGGGGVGTSVTGTGGTASLGGASGIALTGADGSSGTGQASNNIAFAGPVGAASPFGGGGGGNQNGGGTAKANTGAGGGAGAGGNSGAAMNAGGSGAAGGYVDAIIGSPNSTYSYAVGAAGSGGSAGTSGNSGGSGGSGIIIVEEHYWA